MAQPARTREGKFICQSDVIISKKIIYLSFSEIEQQVLEIQAKNAAAAAANGENEEGRISLSKANMDTDIYGGTNLSSYHTSIPANDDAEYDVSFFSYVCDDKENIFDLFYRIKDEDTENANGSADNDEYDVYKKAINAFQAPKNYLQDVVDDVSLFFHLKLLSF